MASLLAARSIGVHEEKPGKVPPACREIEREPMRIAVLPCSKVLFIGRALSANIRIANLELIQLAGQASTHIIDLTHSAKDGEHALPVE